MTSPDLGFLDDMLSAARTALLWIDGLTDVELASDEKTFDAVVRKLEIIGEAANQVSAETRARLARVPWTAVIAQRHVAIHHYRKLSPTRIWATVRNDLPELVDAIGTYLEAQP